VLQTLLIAAGSGYFLGALPFGFLVSRAKGVNIFEEGSRNPGATNVKRVLGEKFGSPGKRLGDLVFFLDALKGAVATGWILLAVRLAGPGFLGGAENLLEAQITGLVAALVGHSFCCFTGFRGGKGVATATGGFLVLLPLATLIAAVVWISTFYSSRYVSLASILAAVALPLAAWLLRQPLPVVVIATLVGLFVILRHRANISRLLKGTENKFAPKAGAAK